MADPTVAWQELIDQGTANGLLGKRMYVVLSTIRSDPRSCETALSPAGALTPRS